jgi:S1-C subfamily serine protease
MTPLIYSAVRAVGVLKPRFQDQPAGGKVFADSLDVLGTAFWLKNEKALITCAHIVRGLAEAPLELAGLLVVGHQENYVRATISAVDYAHDLAVLRLAATPDIIDAEAASGLRLADCYPEVGARVGYAGFPLGRQLLDASQDPTYAMGVIGTQKRLNGERKSIQISGPVVGGYSGSPIVQEASPEEVIGIVSDSPSREAGQASIFMATSWEHIAAIARLAVS